MSFYHLKANSNRYIAEMTGTFFLVFNGCGAIAVNSMYGGIIGHIGIAATFGLTVMIMIYAIGNISGAHLNPAVSIGFLLVKKLSFIDTVFYVLSQFTGAVIAGLFLRTAFPLEASLGVTLPSHSSILAFSFEVVLTMMLMFVILNVSTGHMEKG